MRNWWPENEGAAFHRGRFEMHVMTKAYVREELGYYLPTPLLAEIRTDDGEAMLLHFTAAESMAEFIREMLPRRIEIYPAEHEDTATLDATLQSSIVYATRPRPHLVNKPAE